MGDSKKQFGARMHSIDLKPHFNWPRGQVKGKFWVSLKDKISKAPGGSQKFWGIPFSLGEGNSKKAVLASTGMNTLGSAFYPLPQEG